MAAVVPDVAAAAAAAAAASVVDVAGRGRNNIIPHGGAAVAAAAANYETMMELTYAQVPWLRECCEKFRTNENDSSMNISKLHRFAKDSTTSFIVMDAIAKSLRGNTKLEIIDLSFCCRDDPKILLTLFDKVLSQKSQKKEGMQQPGNSTPKETALAKGANGGGVAASGLHTLYLLNNAIDDDIAIELFKSLETNTSLRDLHIDGNFIGDKGATGLAKLIRVNKTLKAISITCNKLGDVSCQEIAKALPYNASGLQALFMSYNNVTDVGIKALRDALEVSTTGLEVLRVADSKGTGNAALESMKRDNEHHDKQCKRNAEMRSSYQKLRKLQKDADGRRVRRAKPSSPVVRTKIAPEFESGLWPAALSTISAKPDYLYNVIRSQPTLFSVEPHSASGDDEVAMEMEE